MFDVGDLPVLTFGNCVIKWPVRFLRFFQNPKKHDFFAIVLSCCTRFSNTAACYDASSAAGVASHQSINPSINYHHLDTSFLTEITRPSVTAVDIRRRLVGVSQDALEQQPITHQALPWYRELILQPQLSTVGMPVGPLHHRQPTSRTYAAANLPTPSTPATVRLPEEIIPKVA